jgi:quinoprotein glucose dehydrogenase
MRRYFWKAIKNLPLTILFIIILSCSNKGGSGTVTGAGDNWSFTGGTEKQTKYSELDQINKSNVAELEVAWIYNSGEMAGNVQGNPLIIDGVIYITTPSQKLIALDAEQGRRYGVLILHGIMKNLVG